MIKKAEGKLRIDKRTTFYVRKYTRTIDWHRLGLKKPQLHCSVVQLHRSVVELHRGVVDEF